MLNTKWRCVFLLLAVGALTSPVLAADKVLSVVATGTGYVATDDDFWTIMTPVIINSGKQQ